MAPRVVVVGCGATGSVYAGLLAAAGVEVWAVDLRSDHIGLRFTVLGTARRQGEREKNDTH